MNVLLVFLSVMQSKEGKKLRNSQKRNIEI